MASGPPPRDGGPAPPEPESRGRYHHGALRASLVAAAHRILAEDGVQALSLRAVAREAGVSPAAPYHHFVDKAELLQAVAEDGFRQLGDAIRAAQAEDPSSGLAEFGTVYVRFAREHRSLYRLMYETAREHRTMPHAGAHAGMDVVRETLLRGGLSARDPVGLEVACISAWCFAHGVAEMAAFAGRQGLEAAAGGADAFVRALFAATAVGQRR